MKAAITLLSDYHTQNIARKMVYQISQYGGVKFFGSLLPAHVSLKQTFTFEDIARLETWFDSFAQRVSPLCIALNHIYYGEWDDTAIVGLGVHESPTLRGLHNRLNDELKNVVRDPSAPHDGEEYRFHLTVELGKINGTNSFKQFYQSLSDTNINLSFLADHIALFFYADGAIEPGSFMCYKVLPLTG